MNPDMESERQELVTPMLRWVVGWMKAVNIGTGWFVTWGVVLGLVMVAIGVGMGRYGEGVRGWVGDRMGWEGAGGDGLGEEDGKAGNGGGEGEKKG